MSSSQHEHGESSNSKDWAEQLDRHVRAIVQWHFHPETGSPFWLRRAKELSFDPIREVTTHADLRRFPDVADEWRTTPLRDLIPRGSTGPFYVWESGGTTGAPRRIVETGERYQFQQRVVDLLAAHGFPSADDESIPRDWLHVGPSGPHGNRRGMQLSAQLRRSLFYTLDLDPRWVKILYRQGRHDEAGRYIDHILKQVEEVLDNQPVGILSITPPLLMQLVEHPRLAKLVKAKIRGVVWFGTSISDETLRLLDEELPNTKIVGVYGNTMMNGSFVQKVPKPNDPFRCIFHHQNPVWPYFNVVLFDPKNPERLVEPGETGCVRLDVLGKDLFLPNHVERDLAVRVAVDGPGIGIARVTPADGARPEVEGVY